MVQVTTRVAGSYFRSAIPIPVVSTAGTSWEPTSGTWKDSVAAEADPPQRTPLNTHNATTNRRWTLNMVDSLQGLMAWRCRVSELYALLRAAARDSLAGD